MKKSILLTIFVIAIIARGLTQVSYEKRVEFELKNGYYNEEIIELGKSGFIMLSQTHNRSNSEGEYKYEKFNINLESVDSKSIYIPRKQREIDSYTNDTHIHRIFKSIKGKFTIVSMETESFNLKKVEGSLPKKTSIDEIVVLGDYTFISATIKRSPIVFVVNWKTGAMTTTPINIDNFNPKHTTLMNFQVIENSNEVFLYVNVLNKVKEDNLYIIQFDDKGVKKKVMNLTKDVEENIVDISTTKLDHNKYVHTGTYSTRSQHTSEGLFFCVSKNEAIEFIKFYNFLDLENFLSYLPERRIKKIEKKKKKKESKGKDFIINYRIAAHETILLKDGYLFLGEAYYPTYRTETYTTTSYVNGVATTTTQTRTVFDGFQYTHAILGKFDFEGNLVWDEIFEMNSLRKPYFVKRFISIAEQNPNLIKLVYGNSNYIDSKSIDFDGNVVQESKSKEIKTNFENDKIKRTFSNLDFWYDNYFIAYGNQKIKNSDDTKDTKRKRTVYFINKIKFK